jgi:hypothetical protein
VVKFAKMNADRRINPPATRWKGCALVWDELLSLRLARDGLHLVAVGFTPWLAAKDKSIIPEYVFLA